MVTDMARPIEPHHQYSYEDYLRLEEESDSKHEYLDGDIYLKGGGTPEHAALAGAVITALSNQLRDRPCVVYTSDLKVQVAATKLTTYPDVTVICGAVERDRKSKDVALNPTLVVEVTSPSTERWDRDTKLAHFKQIPSLRACLFVSHRERRLDLVWRDGGEWRTESAGPGATLRVPPLDCALVVDDIYRDVAL